MATDRDIIKDAMERYDESAAGSSAVRAAAREDIRFCNLGDQWPDWAKRQRQLENRPFWTVNRLRPMVRQVENSIRQSRPGINVQPVDNGADIDTAEVIREIIRSITRTPSAELASDTAASHAIIGGFGFMRVAIEYAHERSFDMMPTIKRIMDPMLVHWDVQTNECDASDWRYGFISESLARSEFERRYPKRALIDWQGSDAQTAAHLDQWSDEEQVRIAEYFSRDAYEFELVGLSNGIVLPRDEMPKRAKQVIAEYNIDPEPFSDDDAVQFVMQEMGIEETRARKATGYKVTRRVISGEGVLEEDEWPGRTIPIIPVWGEETVIDGRREVRGMVRDAKDPQQLLNFWRTNATERGALAPKATWLIEDGSIPPGHEEAWRTANTRNHAYLAYTNGSTRPERIQPPTIPTGDLQLAMNAAEDLQSITGFYPAALGGRSKETSGRAILARQRETDTGAFHFTDNLNRGQKYLGQVLVDIIPHVYSERQVVRLVGEDMTEKVFKLTSKPGLGTQVMGDEKIYDLSTGVYDIHITEGVNHASQRAQDQQVTLELVRAFPQALEQGFDIAVDSLDLSNKDEWKERFQEVRGMQSGGAPVGAQPMGPPPVPMRAQPQIAPSPPLGQQ